MNIPINVTELRHRLQVQKRYVESTTLLIDKAKAEVAVMEAQLSDLFPPVEEPVEASESSEVESGAGSAGLTGTAAEAQVSSGTLPADPIPVVAPEGAQQTAPEAPSSPAEVVPAVEHDPAQS